MCVCVCVVCVYVGGCVCENHTVSREIKGKLVSTGPALS